MKPLSKLVCIHLIHAHTYTQICVNPPKYFSITIDPVDKVAAVLVAQAKHQNGARNKRNNAFNGALRASNQSKR